MWARKLGKARRSTRQSKLAQVDPFACEVPRIVNDTATYLEDNCLNEQGLFRVPGWQRQVKEIKALYDRDKPVDLSSTHGPHTVASVLKLFLSELDEPLLTFELMDCFLLSVDVIDVHGEDGTENEQDELANYKPNLQAICSCLRLLPLGNRLILHRIALLFKRIAAKSDVNSMTPSNLATCIAPVVVRRPEDPTDVNVFLEESKKGVKLMETVITSFDIIFPRGAESADVAASDSLRAAEEASAQARDVPGTDSTPLSQSLHRSSLMLAANMLQRQFEQLTKVSEDVPDSEQATSEDEDDGTDPASITSDGGENDTDQPERSEKQTSEMKLQNRASLKELPPPAGVDAVAQDADPAKPLKSPSQSCIRRAPPGSSRATAPTVNAGHPLSSSSESDGESDAGRKVVSSPSGGSRRRAPPRRGSPLVSASRAHSPTASRAETVVDTAAAAQTPPNSKRPPPLLGSGGDGVDGGAVQPDDKVEQDFPSFAPTEVGGRGGGASPRENGSAARGRGGAPARGRGRGGRGGRGAGGGGGGGGGVVLRDITPVRKGPMPASLRNRAAPRVKPSTNDTAVKESPASDVDVSDIAELLRAGKQTEATSLLRERSAMMLHQGLHTFKFSNGDIYIGMFQDGKRHGQGEHRYANGDVYVGQFSYGTRHGRGTYRDTQGNVYEGEYKNGQREGQGTLRLNDRVYTGSFANGRQNGHGHISWANGDCYEGEFVNDLFHGRGHYKCAHYEYEGEFVKGVKHGQAQWQSSNGSQYEGEFRDDNICGHGRYRARSGDLYEGEFKDGKFHGIGTYTFADTGDQLTGRFEAGQHVGDA